MNKRFRLVKTILALTLSFIIMVPTIAFANTNEDIETKDSEIVKIILDENESSDLVYESEIYLTEEYEKEDKTNILDLEIEEPIETEDNTDNVTNIEYEVLEDDVLEDEINDDETNIEEDKNNNSSDDKIDDVITESPKEDIYDEETKDEFIEEPDEDTADETEDSIIDEENKEEAEEEIKEEVENEDEISPIAASNPATEIYVSTVEGTSVGEPKVETLNSGKGMHITANTSVTLKNVYDSHKPVTITLQRKGMSFLWQNASVTGNIDMRSNTYGTSSDDFYSIYTLTPRDQDIKQSIFRFEYIPYSADGKTVYPEKSVREVIINWGNGDKSEGPETPVISFDKSNPDNYILSGIDSTMEYRKGTETEWTECPDNEVFIPVPETTSDVVHVRYKATDSSEASQSKSINIPARETAPDVDYTYLQQEVKVTSDMEYSVDEGEYRDVTDKMINDGELYEIIDNIPQGGTATLRIRNKATSLKPASKCKEIVLYPKGAALTDLSFNYTNYSLNYKSGDALQYRIENAEPKTKWSSFTSNPMYFEKKFLRIKKQ